LRKEKSSQSGKGLGAPPKQLSTSSYRAHSVTIAYILSKQALYYF